MLKEEQVQLFQIKFFFIKYYFVALKANFTQTYTLFCLYYVMDKIHLMPFWKINFEEKALPALQNYWTLLP